MASTTTVLGLPAANRAKCLISNAVAQMAPMKLFGTDGFLVDNPPNILTRPNSVYTTFDFFQMATELAIMRGNFVGILADFDTKGYAQQIVPVAPGFFLAYVDGAGYTVYSIAGHGILSRDQVVHIRANGAPQQPMGLGVVEQFRRSIGLALDQQNYAADTFRSGSVPAGIVSIGFPEVSKAQSDFVQSQWIANHSGGRAPAVLPNTMKFEAMQWSPADTEFLQSRVFTIGEIAHMFNLDPTDLGSSTGDSLTYSNIEQRQQQRITDSYAPWMLRFEQEWSDLVPGAGTAKMCPENLLRTDSKTTAEVEQLEIANETMTVDEARKKRGKKPLPKPPVPKVAPGAPGAPAGDAAGAVDGALLADAPQPVPDDPNITQTPVKVKV